MLTNSVNENTNNTQLKPRMHDGFNTEVYDQIMRFLKGYKGNTAKAYEGDVRSFFKYKVNKEIEHLKREDLNYTIEQFEDYQAFILETLGNSASTTSRYITSITECMKHLHRRGLVDDIRFLDIKRPKVRNNSWDGLTIEEVRKAANYIINHGRTGKIKHALLRFVGDTCMRMEECLSLTWDNFIEKDDEVLVRTIAKGDKPMNRRISKSVYSLLLDLKVEGESKVFNISNSTIDRMMPEIRDILNIDPKQRRITFHSIRKAGAQYIWEKTRDINQVSKALGHESIQTTELYINKNEDYGVFGAFSDEYETDEHLFEKVSHIELLNAIRQMGKDKQLFLNLKIKETLS